MNVFRPMCSIMHWPSMNHSSNAFDQCVFQFNVSCTLLICLLYAVTFLTVHLKKVLWNVFIAYYSILFCRQNFPRFSNDLDIEMFYWKKPPEVFGRLKKSAERNLNLSKHAKLRIPVQKEKRFSSQRPLQKK